MEAKVVDKNMNERARRRRGRAGDQRARAS